MKKILAITVLSLVSAIVACKKDDPVNLYNPQNLTSPLNCPVGSVLTPQGVLAQGSCPYGQGMNASNQCVQGTACQGIGAVGSGTIVSYYNPLQITCESCFENLMAEQFGFCQKDLAWGNYACTSYNKNLELIIEAVIPSTGLVQGSNGIYVTIYAGAQRVPLVFPMSYWPILNSAGFELRSFNPVFVRVNSGSMSTASNQTPNQGFDVEVYYKNAVIARGSVSRFR